MENFPVFRKTILEGAAPVMDTDAVGAEIGAAAAAMTDGQPLDALLLECTDLSLSLIHILELTPEGLEMARESFLAQTDMEKRLLTMLSPEEKEQLRTLLKRILLDLEERGEV